MVDGGRGLKMRGAPAVRWRREARVISEMEVGMRRVRSAHTNIVINTSRPVENNIYSYSFLEKITMFP
jgi:hypothetical protein